MKADRQWSSFGMVGPF